jgi:hypothetical protein
MTHPPPRPSHNSPPTSTTASTPQSALSPCPSSSLPQWPALSAKFSASAPQLSSSPQRESLCQVARIHPPATTDSHPLSAFEGTTSEYTIHTHPTRTASQLFKLLDKYCPEAKQEKKARLAATAKAVAEGKEIQKARLSHRSTVELGLTRVVGH